MPVRRRLWWKAAAGADSAGSTASGLRPMSTASGAGRHSANCKDGSALRLEIKGSRRRDRERATGPAIVRVEETLSWRPQARENRLDRAWNVVARIRPAGPKQR